MRLAQALGVRASISTASDLSDGVALDMLPDGWRLEAPEAARAAMARLIDGGTVALSSEVSDDLLDWLDWTRPRSSGSDPIPPRNAWGADRWCASRTAWCPIGPMWPPPATGPWRRPTLILRPPTLALGVGCERGCDPGELENLTRETLARQGLSAGSVACLVSLDLKADEPAVLALGRALDVPLRFLDAETLERETPRLANPSETVFREVGCHGVAEAAALAAAGPDGTLIGPKRKSPRATCAVARNPAGITPDWWGGRAGSAHRRHRPRRRRLAHARGQRRHRGGHRSGGLSGLSRPAGRIPARQGAPYL